MDAETAKIVAGIVAPIVGIVGLFQLYYKRKKLIAIVQYSKFAFPYKTAYATSQDIKVADLLEIINSITHSDTIIHIRILNKGRLPLKDIHLFVNGSRLIYDLNKKHSLTIDNDSITIDKLQPEQEIELFIWTLSLWKKIRLSHSEGIGKVCFKIPDEHWINKYAPFFLGVMTPVLPAAIIIIFKHLTS